MCDDKPYLIVGFTSPMFREVRFAKDEPRKEQSLFGFVHFASWKAEPERDPESDLRAYIEFIQEFDDELHVGFTAPDTDVF